MRIRNIDKNNDWRFGKGQSNYTRDTYAVGLDIKLRLQEWYSDCYFNLAQGIPWDIRLGERNQKELLDQDVMETAKSVEGVLSIYEFSSTVTDRRYKCSFRVYQSFSTDTLPITFDSEEVING